MIVLGLGSNIGHRLNHLRQAITHLNHHPKIQVKQCSPLYQSRAQLTPGAPMDWGQPFLNMAVHIETSLSPFECLDALKVIEQKMGREDFGRWAPRTIDIDILDWNQEHIQEIRLQTPHTRLGERPFTLFPLLDLNPFWQHPNPSQNQCVQNMLALWGNRFDGQAPFETKQIHQRADGPRLVGILNITPDSFRDGSKFLKPEAAIQQAEQLFLGGAEVLDIGAESTRHGAKPITALEEWKRLEPVLKALPCLNHHFLDAPTICIDTRHAATAEKALANGANWLNDVSGLSDPAYIQLVKESECTAIFMHHLDIPANKANILPNHPSFTKQVKDWLFKKMEQLIQAGIDPSQLIADIGIGFGKSPAQDMFLLQHIRDFKDLPLPLLVGHSCKSFLGHLFTGAPPAERQLETSLLSVFLAREPVHYLRVHDTLSTARALKLSQAYGHAYPSPYTSTHAPIHQKTEYTGSQIKI